MTTSNILAVDVEQLIASIMARKHAASGTAVLVDPVILRLLIEKASYSLETPNK